MQLFFCGNRSYQTDTNKGYPHMSSQTRGSVLPTPITIHENGASLWLEYVIELETSKSLYWLMWYDKDGNPIIRQSTVFDKQDLSNFFQAIIEGLL